MMFFLYSGDELCCSSKHFCYVIPGGSSKIIKKTAMEDDPQRRKPDITRAKTFLNWQPKVQSSNGWSSVSRLL